MASTKKAELEIDVRDLIISELEENQERDLAWLSRKTGIPYTSLYSCFKLRLFVVNDENMNKINEALNSKFKN